MGVIGGKMGVIGGKGSKGPAELSPHRGWGKGGWGLWPVGPDGRDARLSHSRTSCVPSTMQFKLLNMKRKETRMHWSTPTLVEICIGLEINGYLPADF